VSAATKLYDGDGGGVYTGQDPSVSGAPLLSIPYPEEHVLHMLFEHELSEQLSGHFLLDFIKKYAPTPRPINRKITRNMITASI
jgi:hypothetical protein